MIVSLLLYAISISLVNYDSESVPLFYNGTTVNITEYETELAADNSKLSGIAIGNSTLNDVQKKFGVSQVYKDNTYEESPDALYYISSINDDNTVVIFASGPMGGWETVDNITITTKDMLEESNIKCTPTKLISRNMRTDSGLVLGLNKQQVENIIGVKPTMVVNDTYVFSTSVQKKMTDAEFDKARSGFTSLSDNYYTLWWYIEARFKNDRLVYINITTAEEL
ncbi:MAG: hypothetical protein HZA22_12080 [Nitrospirae bacterium]|nr:hypothetical protein [Nitrospirota bacterium]MBI5694866.1 hypothetical protein [Nitrospirota bacterium]